MPPGEELDARLWCRQTNQRRGHELRAGPLLRRTALDVPRARGVHAENGHSRGLQLRDDGWEGITQRAAE